MDTPQASVVDLGTSFGLKVGERETELHVFKGAVRLRRGTHQPAEDFLEGGGAVVEGASAIRRINASAAAFAALIEMPEKLLAAQALRYGEWRAANERLNDDPSLLVHFDFENMGAFGWLLQNAAHHAALTPTAMIIGCQRGEGRWPGKQSLEFQSVNDRVRLNVPGEFDALTLAAWVCVKGLDREINSLFMSDGFEPGTIHWLIRHDGVLGLTVIGAKADNYQVVASPPALTLNNLGTWIHLAVVLDGFGNRVVHYVNGRPIGEKTLRISPPFRVGAAELGNWNAMEFPKSDPFMIRNFSGALDEFCLFGRALDPEEVRVLHAQGKPQADSFAAR